MSAPAELTATDCPLLRDSPTLKVADLLSQFNQLAGEIGSLNQGPMAYLLGRDDVKGIVDDIERVRQQLARPRYRVGFLGTSQAGKSTTFNNVLQETLAQGGIGDATTSLITRTRRIGGSPTAARTFKLRFMSESQFRERRDKLCKAIHLLNSNAHSNQEILAYLADPKGLAAMQAGAREQGESDLARKRRDRTGDNSVLPDDIPYLRDFLRAYDVHGARVVARSGPQREIEAPFEKRSLFLNHASDASGTPSENLLLYDAEIGTPNPNVPIQLEAIDCPGLGSKRTVDTLMTKEFLSHLDGALIFLKADQLRSKDVVEILEILKTNFGKLEGRVWVVVNKFDGLTREPLYGDADGRTVFDLIHEFSRDYGIPGEQIVFTSKKIFELATECGGKAPVERAADRLGVPANDPIPPRCKADRIQFAMFQHLLEDGGVSHLRKLILETVSDAVSTQIGQTARRELQLLREELTHRVETEERRRKGGRQQRDEAIQCHDLIQELLMELGTRTEFFRPLADHLRHRLYERLVPNETRIRVIMHMTVDQLAKQFQLHAETLDQELDDVMNADVIDRLYGEVADKMNGLPAVPLTRHPGGLMEAWQAFRREDRDPKTWRKADFPSFRSVELFSGLTNSEVFSNFDGEAYLGLMQEKIRIATQQVMHAVRVQMRRRLRTLERELGMLIYKPDEN